MLMQFHMYLCRIMPQLPSIVLPNGIVVYIWHITETQEYLKQRYEECLLASRETENQYGHDSNEGKSGKDNKIRGNYHPLEEFTVSANHIHYLASRILLHSVFGEHRLERDLHGKPHLKDLQSGIHSADSHINYSHANDWVVLACHDQHPVGIDIESARPQLHRIYKRFCSSQEMDWMGEEPSTLLLQKAWCSKEALYKALGKKGTDFRNHLFLHPFNEDSKSLKAEILNYDIHKGETRTIEGVNPIEIPETDVPTLQNLSLEIHFIELGDMIVAATYLPLR